jgi:ribonuclease E
VRGGREIGRADVQELRKDLAHYSAQMGLVLAPGEAGRDARSEASAAGQAPVALYAGEALPEEMIACRVGVTVQTVEVPDVDEAFFAGLLRHREERLEGRARTETEGRGGERRHDRDERPLEEPLPEVTSESVTEVPETALQPEPAALPDAEPLHAHEPEAGAPAPSGEPASPPVEGEEPREVRRRRGREDRPRATNAAEQAWGQPAGTMKFAPPPGPTVVAQTTSREESPPADPGESAEEPEQPPQDPKPDSF